MLLYFSSFSGALYLPKTIPFHSATKTNLLSSSIVSPHSFPPQMPSKLALASQHACYIPQIKKYFIKVSKLTYMLFCCKIGFSLLLSDYLTRHSYSHLIFINFSTNTSTIVIILWLFIWCFTTSSHCSSFIKIPTPPIPSLFPDHNHFYLLSLIPTNQAPWLFHLTSSWQHAFSFLFFNFSHTFVHLPLKPPIIQLPKLTWSRLLFVNLKALFTICPF